MSVTMICAGATNRLDELNEWDRGGSLTTGVGYRDNLAFAHFHPRGSAFWLNGLEFLWWHRPSSGFDFQWVFNFEDVRFFSPYQVQKEVLDREQSIFTSAQWKVPLGKSWTAACAFDFAYQDQLVDVSTPDLNTPGVIQTNVLHVQGENLQVTPSLRRDWTASLWTEASFSAALRPYSAPLDDYDEYGPKVTMGWSPGSSSDLTASVGQIWRNFASQTVLDERGRTLPGTHLTYRQTRVDLAWKCYWDARQRWRTVLQGSYKWSEDNGSGILDFARFQGSAQVRYSGRKWEVSGTMRLTQYFFPSFPAAGAFYARRDRIEVNGLVRLSRRMGRHWKVYAEVEHEFVGSDQTADEYTVNQTTAGLSWEF